MSANGSGPASVATGGEARNDQLDGSITSDNTKSAAANASCETQHWGGL
jgi:hypothetical protein